MASQSRKWELTRRAYELGNSSPIEDATAYCASRVEADTLWRDFKRAHQRKRVSVILKPLEGPTIQLT